MPKKPVLKPGQKAEISGQYELTGPRGGSREREATMTIVKDEHAPPTPEPNMTWRLVDRTRHKQR